ncbi:MAG: antibiotic biosynthesis monooxygenase, partial [Leptolinea sp.]
LAFINATLENARNSIKEPGIARFDILQDSNDPSRFILFEVYRTAEDPKKHKETQHYITWRDSVADMMAEQRRAIQYVNLFPEDNGWG